MCNTYVSARKNTFVESNLPISKIGLFVAYFLHINHPRVRFLTQESKLFTRTVVDWSNFCCKVCVEWCMVNSCDSIGESSKVVEIRKHSRGRISEGQLIFGGIERGSSKIFIIPVQNRTADTLVPLITEHVLQGTTIMSDCWKSYRNLNRVGFTHFATNHKYNFVDPDSG